MPQPPVPAENELTSSGRPAAGALGQWSWALFEWARNPYYILIVIYIFGPYFSHEIVGDPIQGQAIWGYVNGFAGLCIACFAPFLGAIADGVGKRKPWIAAFVILMAPSILLLWLAVPGGDLGVIAVAAALTFAGLGFAFTEVFHNAMLADVAPVSRIGTVSGMGLALGNGGALIILVFMLYAFALPADPGIDWAFLPEAPLFGLDPAEFEHIRVSAPITAVWLLVFALPLFLFTPDAVAKRVPVGQAIRAGVADTLTTLRELRKYRNITRYLIARMFFNDGKVAIMTFSALYASGVFGWGAVELLIFGIVLSLIAVLGGFLGGILDDRIGSKQAVMFTIGGNAVALVAAVSITPTSLFFIEMEGLDREFGPLPYFNTLPEMMYVGISMLFAVFITSAYANSRTLLARIAPLGMMTKFFGLYALSGQVTAFVASLLVAFTTQIFQSQRAGFASILILLVVGLVLMVGVEEKRTEAAGD